MRVAIIKGNGHLDRQIERLLNQHGIKGDFIDKLYRYNMNQYDCVIISHRNSIPNIPILLERIVLAKTTSVIYITGTSSIGHLYNVYNDLYFNPVNEITLEVELPVTIKMIDKYMKEIHHLQTRHKDVEERLETLKLTNKAKRLLMKKGLSEEDSHQFIQKKSMDMRLSKRQFVNLIIENKIDI